MKLKDEKFPELNLTFSLTYLRRFLKGGFKIILYSNKITFSMYTVDPLIRTIFGKIMAYSSIYLITELNVTKCPDKGVSTVYKIYYLSKIFEGKQIFVRQAGWHKTLLSTGKITVDKSRTR